MDDHDGSTGDAIWAQTPASKAYCNAMPMLVGYEGARDFIACAAHGILIGAIPREKGGQLLSAARVALAAIQREREPPKPPSARASQPSKKMRLEQSKQVEDKQNEQLI
ncbi:MAG: hypothetical protein P4L26_07950 [Terracidiphilus sp.]|nr:hypothetical protein [Terracidiphilus sp.]